MDICAAGGMKVIQTWGRFFCPTFRQDRRTVPLSAGTFKLPENSLKQAFLLDVAQYCDKMTMITVLIKMCLDAANSNVIKEYEERGKHNGRREKTG